MHYYNARWYDSSLGRFAQADTIVPGGVQGYDRYAYVNNNPVRYTDPSGHEPGTHCDRGYCDPNDPTHKKPLMYATQQLGLYGITTNGTQAQNEGTLQAAQLAGDKLASTIGGGISSQQAFLTAHGNISIIFGADRVGCITEDHTITCGSTKHGLVQTMIHEFGHVFDNQFKAVVGGEFWASSYPENGWDNTYEGYKCNTYPCIQHPDKDSYWGTRGRDEDFADMYLNWVLDANPAYSQNGFTTDDWGNDRRDMMNNTKYDPINDLYPRGMPVWLRLMGLMP